MFNSRFNNKKKRKKKNQLKEQPVIQQSIIHHIHGYTHPPVNLATTSAYLRRYRIKHKEFIKVSWASFFTHTQQREKLPNETRQRRTSHCFFPEVKGGGRILRATISRISVRQSESRLFYPHNSIVSSEFREKPHKKSFDTRYDRANDGITTCTQKYSRIPRSLASSGCFDTSRPISGLCSYPRHLLVAALQQQRGPKLERVLARSEAAASRVERI